MVFLLAMTIILGIYIFTQGLSSYQSTRESTEEVWNPSIDCTRYIYSISDISYSDSLLSFRFENLDFSGHEISNITVSSDRNNTINMVKILARGTYTKIQLSQFELKDNFTIYPDGCSVFRKTCRLSTGQCTAYEPPEYKE